MSAGPGTGKSAFVLTYALKAGVPTFYLSADSDAFTQLSRSISILTGRTLESAEQAIRDDTVDAATNAALDAVPIMFVYEASPTLQQLEDPLEAFGQKYGDYPALIVVDNITNVRTEGGKDDDDSGLEALMDYLHDMARKTGACVIGLHHVTGQYNDANKPIPLSGVKGQIARVPELVLTLFRIPSEYGSDSLNVSTVKNRAGKADPSGQSFVSLNFDGPTMTIGDP